MADGKKKPEDETPKAQAEDAKPSEDLSDDELSNAAGGMGCSANEFGPCLLLHGPQQYSMR